MGTLTGRDLLERIADALGRRSVTSRDVARRLGLPEESVARMLAPDRPMRAAEVASIFDALGLSREDLPTGFSEGPALDGSLMQRLATLEQRLRGLEERLARLECKDGPDA